MNYKIENAKQKFFKTKEAYLAFRAVWKELARAKNLRAADMLLFNLVTGRDSTSGFSPIVNKRKLEYQANGNPLHTYKLVLFCLRNYIWQGKYKGTVFLCERFIEQYKGTLTLELLFELDKEIK